MDCWWLKGVEDTGLWIGVISRDAFDGLTAEQRAIAQNDFGYFLYRHGPHGMTVYAKFLDADDAHEFAEQEGFILHSRTD